MKLLSKLALVTALAVVSFASTATAATVVNGNFEAGGPVGWTIFTIPGSAGSWQPYSGTTSPISSGDTDPIPAAIGTVSAVADQTGEMAAVMYQDVALEPGMTHQLDLSYWYSTFAPFTATNNTGFAFPAGPDVQQVFLDVIKPTADPMTANPADTLANVYRSNLGDAPSIGWTNASVDLTGFAGQTVRIRFLDVNQNDYLLLGVDNVAITSKDVTAPAIASLKLSKSRFRTVGKRRGTKVSFTLSETSALVLTVEKRAKGKRSGSKCVKPTSKNKTKKNCIRWIPVRGSIKAAGIAGSNGISFSGKLNRKSLAPGKYRMKINAADPAGNTSAVLKSFTVLP